MGRQWGAILQQHDGGPHVTPSLMLAQAVAQGLADHGARRSCIVSDSQVHSARFLEYGTWTELRSPPLCCWVHLPEARATLKKIIQIMKPQLT